MLKTPQQLKLGIQVSQSTVAKYMVKHHTPPSQTWRTFLDNHVKRLVSVDFFVVPTVSFRILYVFLVLAHKRRRVVHLKVTEHPTTDWTAAPLMQAFPWDTPPQYMLRDRNRPRLETVALACPAQRGDPGTIGIGIGIGIAIGIAIESLS